MKKSTIQSPANIAFIKYWGRRNDTLILPLNNSISMNLSNCLTTTTVEFGDFEKDEVKLNLGSGSFVSATGGQLERVVNQLNRIRNYHDVSQRAKIYSENNFPTGVGIASSASGFSALTKAIYQALEIDISEKNLSIETRLAGSGSASRSIPDGFVEWESGVGDNSESSYSYSLASPNHWDLTDLVVVVDQKHKKIGSYEGHSGAQGNEYMKARLKNINQRLIQTRQAIKEKDLEKLGTVIENDAVSLHAVAMLSSHPIFYLNGRSFDVIHKLFDLREEGLYGYYTIDAGPNIHVICESKDSQKIKEELLSITGVHKIIENKPCNGAEELTNHLF